MLANHHSWYFDMLMSDHFEGADWPEVSRLPDWEEVF